MKKALLLIPLIILLCSSGYAVSRDGLVAYLNFDNNFNDSSPLGVHDVITNGAVLDTNGKVNGGAYKGDDLDYMYIVEDDSKDYMDNGKNITVNFWIYLNDTSITGQRTVHMNNAWSINFNGAQKEFRFLVYNTTGFPEIESDVAVSEKEWIMVTCMVISNLKEL